MLRSLREVGLRELTILHIVILGAWSHLQFICRYGKCHRILQITWYIGVLPLIILRVSSLSRHSTTLAVIESVRVDEAVLLHGLGRVGNENSCLRCSGIFSFWRPLHDYMALGGVVVDDLGEGVLHAD